MRSRPIESIVRPERSLSVSNWPAPEVPCRPAENHYGPYLEGYGPEIPKGAESILKVAEVNDWQITRKTYARGTLPVGGTEWKEGPVVDSLVIGGRKDDLSFVASWVAGSFSFAYVAKRASEAGSSGGSDLRSDSPSKSRGQMTSVKSTELRAVLTGELS
jgi:hypothetical protein